MVDSEGVVEEVLAVVAQVLVEKPPVDVAQ